MKEDIERVVLQSVESIGKKINLTDLPVEVEVDIPKRKEFGDFSINTAMVLAKKMGRNPRQVAEMIIENLPGDKDRLFRKVEIAGAGFINFFVREEAIVNKLEEITRLGGKFGASDLGKGLSVLVEFVSANPTGYLHMGHARNAVVGDTISNILSASGYKVSREFYINDAGRQMELLGESVFARYAELFGQTAEIPEDGYKGDYVIEIAAEIKESEGDSLLDKPRNESLAFAREFARERLLGLIKDDLEDIGIRFDVWYSEKEHIHGRGENGSAPGMLGEIKKRLADAGALEEKEGALWFAATRYGDSQDWVLVKSDGSPTYFLADIAYHADKFERGFGSLINVWGADHHGHVSRLKAALRALGYDDSRFNVVLIQFVRLMRHGEEVSMSKRAGSYVTMRDVVSEVGADVMRFFLLMRSSESHLDFDLDLAKKESSENPVYYIQYAYARIRSLFRKADEERVQESASSLGTLSQPEEVDLVKKLLLYPDVVEDSAVSFAPHKIAYYLQELAADFHAYYNKFRIVDEDRALSGARLYLVRCVQTVLSNGLRLLGISAPERM
ncbi:MAG TPA: arginine--tRNA ligase [Thermodesulfobacteriota bacterium]|nr:arginine--tRNA ligase [Thermodesulfobacteriota bacterium]